MGFRSRERRERAPTFEPAFISAKSLNRHLFTVHNPLLVRLLIGLRKRPWRSTFREPIGEASGSVMT